MPFRIFFLLLFLAFGQAASIVNHTWINQKTIFIKTTTKLKAHEIKFFKFYDRKNKIYRYVFDFKAILRTHKTIAHDQIETIRLKQFNKTTTRLVFSSQKKIRFNYKRQRRGVRIGFTFKIIKKRISQKNKPRPSQKIHKPTLLKQTYKPKRIILHFDENINAKIVSLKRTYRHKQYIYTYRIKAYTRVVGEIKHKKIKKITLNQKDDYFEVIFTNKTKLLLSYKTKNKILTFYTGLHSGHSTSSLKQIASTQKSSVKKTTFSQKKPTVSRTRVRKKVVMIDPGHGGKDPGAIAYSNPHIQEKKITLAIAKKVRKELLKRGYKVYMTRTSDRFITLEDRTKMATKKHVDLFISIHANSVSKKDAKKIAGLETFFLSPSRSKRAEKVAARENGASRLNYSQKHMFAEFLNQQKIKKSSFLALDVHSQIIKNLRKHFKGVIDHGVKEGPFWVLVGAQMPAILIETGFISHPLEAKRLQQNSYQNALAVGICNGIDAYFLKNN